MQPFRILVAVGLLGGWSPLAAQPSQPAPPAFTESVVVTASLEPASPAEIPATVDVVDAAELARRQADLALDALRLVPGLAIAQSGSPGKAASLFVRGASSAQTLVLLDGVTLNDPVLGGFDWSAIGTEGLERIEVARGPFSALWGSQAMGGVVHLVTRRASALAGRLDAEGGSDDQARLSGSVAAPLGAVAFNAAGSVRRGDGELPNDFFDAGQAHARVDIDGGDGLRWGALARWSDVEIGLPFDFFGAPSPERRQLARGWQAALPFEWNRPGWRLEAQLARSEGDLELIDAGDPFAASDSRSTRDQARLVVSGRGSERWRLSGGVDYERQEATTSSAFGPGLADDRQSNRALFAEASFTRARLRVDAGARRDEHSEFGGETSARAGAVVDFGGAGRLRASWGESFRAPALGDLFYPFFGNPDLAPERGESWELGYELARGGWSARVAGFGSDFENLIQFDPILFVPVNIGRARTRGVEASVGWSGRELALRLQATRLDSEDLATGAPLPRRPERSATLVADWHRGAWSVGAAVRHVGDREDVGGILLGAYTASDLTAAWERDARWRPYARVENLFDEAYEEVAGFPAAGRSWIVGLSFRGGA